MANRSSTFLLKRSNVIGKIPELTGLTIGELALNTADAKLYTIFTSGTTGSTEVRQIGWDRISRTGDTVYGDFNFYGNIQISGLTQPSGYTLSITGDTNLIGYSFHSGNTEQIGNYHITGNTSQEGTYTHSGNTFITGNTTQIGNFNLTGDTNLSGNTDQFGSINLTGSTSGQCALYVDGDVCIDGNLNITGNTNMVGTLSLQNSNSLGNTGINIFDTTLIPSGITVVHQFQGEGGIFAHLGDLASGEPNSKGYIYMENNGVANIMPTGTAYQKVSGTTSTIVEYLNFFTTGSSSNELLYTFSSSTGSSSTFLKYSVSYTVQSSGGSKRLSFAIRKTTSGGTQTIVPAAMTLYTSGANLESAGSLSGIVSAQLGDRFEVVVSNGSGAPTFNALISDLTFSLYT